MGKLGTVVGVASPYDYEVKLDVEVHVFGAYYRDASFIHAPQQPSTVTPAVIPTPIIATSTPPPPVRYGRCYFCHNDGESRENGFLMCDEHAERFKRK